MKYRVGDKVKVKRDFSNNKVYEVGTSKEMEKYAGKIMTIRRYAYINAYKMEEDINDCNFQDGWVWSEDMLEKAEFTKSDLQDGDIVTYRDSHKAVVGIDKLKLCGVNEATMMYLADYDEKLNYKTGGHKDTINDIVKVERPTQYETVFEHKEEILDEKEKEYLNAVIRPFRNEIDFIRKERWSNGEQYIALFNKSSIKNSGTLPIFAKNTMYRNMEVDRDYTLKELRFIRSVKY